MVNKVLLLFIGFVFLFLNFLVNYLPMNNVLIILLIIVAWAPILLLNREAKVDLGLKKKVLLAVVAFIIEVLILLVSAFIFESGLLFNMNKVSIWEHNKIIGLYAITGIFVIEELIKYFYIKSHKN